MHSDQCAVFLRGACLEAKHISCTSFRAQRDKPPTSYRFIIIIFFNYYLPIVEGKRWPFLSSFFLFFTRWGKPQIWRNVRSLKQMEKKERQPPRFRPRKRSQSIIIYSHCIAQDHSRTHPKDYFRLMGL